MQNKQNKKKAGDEKNLSPNISTVRALEKIIETDLRSYSAGLPFSFFYHLGTRSCDHPPDDPLDGP